MVSNPHDVDPDRSVDCVFCDALADERETIDLWNKPRFPNGEAHTNCYDEWQDKPTFVVLDLDRLTALHPDDPDAGDELRVAIKSAHLTRERADDLYGDNDRYAIVEVTDDIRPEY